MTTCAMSTLPYSLMWKRISPGLALLCSKSPMPLIFGLAIHSLPPFCTKTIMKTSTFKSSVRNTSFSSRPCRMPVLQNVNYLQLLTSVVAMESWRSRERRVTVYLSQRGILIPRKGPRRRIRSMQALCASH